MDSGVHLLGSLVPPTVCQPELPLETAWSLPWASRSSDITSMGTAASGNTWIRRAPGARQGGEETGTESGCSMWSLSRPTAPCSQ